MTVEPPDYAKGIGDVHGPFPGGQLGGVDQAAMLKQLAGLLDKFIEAALRAVVLKVVGVLLPGPAGTQLSSWATKIMDAFQGININGGPGGVLSAITGGIGALVSKLVNGGQPLNVLNLVGLIRQGNLGQIGTGQIGETARNLLVDPEFKAFSATGAFTPDTVSGQTAAKVVADGSGSKDLLSTPLVEVSEGQTVPIKADVRWQSVTATGSPIRVGVTAYRYDDDTDTYEVVSQTDVITQAISPATSDWRTLSGEYVVPAGVDAIRHRLTLAPTATAGSGVWFTKAHLSKSGKIRLGLLADEDGNGLPDILDDIGGTLSTLGSQIAGKLASGDFAGLLNVLGGSFGSNLSAVGERLDDMLHSGSTVDANQIGGAGSIGDSFVPGLGQIRAGIVNALTRLGVPTASQADTTAALEAQTAAVTGMAAQLAQIQADRTSGVTAGDDFERTGSTAGSNWSFSRLSGSGGSVGTPNGHDLSFQKSGIAEALVIGYYLPTQSTTTQEYSSVVLGSAPEDPNLFGVPTGTPAYDIVSVRMSSDKLTRIDAWFGNDECIIYRWISGTPTELNRGPCPTPGPGSTLTIQAGKPGTARYFKALVNNSQVLDVTEVGVASQLGAGYQNIGGGGKYGTMILTQSAPGRWKQWTGGDQ